MREIIRKGCLVMAILGATYLGTNASLDIGSRLLSEKIKSENHLEVMLDEEISKLGLDDEIINVKFGKPAPRSGAHCKQLSDGSYEIVLGDDERNRAILKHELYHVYGDHHKDSPKSFKGFINENRAILYQSLGIK